MRKDLRLWYGWVILFTVFTILMFTIGIRNSIGVFFKEVSGEFGWNRAQTAAAFTMGMLGQAVVAPLAGWVLERFNMRWVIGAGIFVNGAALIIGTYIGALWHYYAMYFLLSVGFAFTANLPQVQLLANWFVVKRGLAMGFSHAAQGFAPILNIFTPSAHRGPGLADELSGAGGGDSADRAAIRPGFAARPPQRKAHRSRCAFSHVRGVLPRPRQGRRHHSSEQGEE